MKNVQRAANSLIPVLIIFAILYVVFTGGDKLQFALLDWKLWYFSGWVHPASPSPLGQRLLYFVVQIMPVSFGLYAIVAALRIVTLIRTGILFDHRISRGLLHAGIGTVGSGLTDFVANLISPTILSWTNPNGAEPIRWVFDSEPAGLIVCGGGFYLIGWIMAEARRLADENEGFV